MNVTLDTSHSEISPLNSLLTNIAAIDVTLDTSHLEISPLNSIPRNNSDMLVIFEVLMKLRSQLGPSFDIVSFIILINSCLLSGVTISAFIFLKNPPSVIYVFNVFIFIYIIYTNSVVYLVFLVCYH